MQAWEAILAVAIPSVVGALILHRTSSRWTPFVILGGFWAAAIGVLIVHGEPFWIPDLLDPSKLHHEQVIVILVALGVVGAVWAWTRISRAAHGAATQPEARV